MANKSVLAIIVLFNPDFSTLSRLLISVVNQVEKIIIVDNTPNANTEELKKVFLQFNNKIIYKPLGDNYGIAAAQNVGIKFSQGNSFSHVLLLDQDSELPLSMVRDLLDAEHKLLNNNIQVAAVGPAFIDEKTGEKAPAINVKLLHTKKIPIDENKEYIKSDYIIASGSLIRTNILSKFGMMDEKLFIDWVDIEWGERCNKLGYYTFIIPSVLMKHSIGDDFVKFTGKNINLHTDFRNYFIVRNATYLLFNNSLRFRSRLLFLFKIPCYIIFYSTVSKRKIYSVGLLCKAVIDGFFRNMYKGHFK
ncbi:glycosyltransferase family 2 protein [Limnobaculum parvum]|uniref:Glycosyltransferase family 2 protein n=1 Tax=Limnobaculum parvum TaxID=2172103 RepID=A0A2Y9U0S7_9GAMM|nr:glycosyltransferase family 2 protein [Limnobaculum parvum]AWH89666.1 glycosyltransferase family 2 protein [Limnobaculum parvum]